MTNTHQPELPAPSFRLMWRNATYYVSEPNIGDTDVYTAEQMLAMYQQGATHEASRPADGVVEPMTDWTWPDAPVWYARLTATWVEMLRKRDSGDLVSHTIPDETMCRWANALNTSLANAKDQLASAPTSAQAGDNYPGCSGDPASCPENEGHGCCKPNPKCSCPSGDGSLNWPCKVHPTSDAAARASVVPVAWVERTEAGHDRMWSGDLSAWAGRPANPEPLYSQATVDELQARITALTTPSDAGGEVGVLTKALANSDWYGPAAHFKPEEEVIQTRILRTLLKHTPPNPGDARLIPQFMAKWEWLILSRCREEFQKDLLSLLDGKGVL